MEDDELARREKLMKKLGLSAKALNKAEEEAALSVLIKSMPGAGRGPNSSATSVSSESSLKGSPGGLFTTGLSIRKKKEMKKKQSINKSKKKGHQTDDIDVHRPSYETVRKAVEVLSVMVSIDENNQPLSQIGEDVTDTLSCLRRDFLRQAGISQRSLSLRQKALDRERGLSSSPRSSNSSTFSPDQNSTSSSFSSDLQSSPGGKLRREPSDVTKENVTGAVGFMSLIDDNDKLKFGHGYLNHTAAERFWDSYLPRGDLFRSGVFHLDHRDIVSHYVLFLQQLYHSTSDLSFVTLGRQALKYVQGISGATNFSSLEQLHSIKVPFPLPPFLS